MKTIKLVTEGIYLMGYNEKNETCCYYPLTKEAKELDLPLLPEFDNCCEKLAHEFVRTNYPKFLFKSALVEIFEAGYKAAQAKQFTLEDMLAFARFCSDNHTLDDSDKYNIKWTPFFRDGKKKTEIEMFNDWKQSLSTQQLPKEFIISDKFSTFEENLKNGKYKW